MSFNAFDYGLSCSAKGEVIVGENPPEIPSGFNPSNSTIDNEIWYGPGEFAPVFAAKFVGDKITELRLTQVDSGNYLEAVQGLPSTLINTQTQSVEVVMIGSIITDPITLRFTLSQIGELENYTKPKTKSESLGAMPKAMNKFLVFAQSWATTWGSVLQPQVNDLKILVEKNKNPSTRTTPNRAAMNAKRKEIETFIRNNAGRLVGSSTRIDTLVPVPRRSPSPRSTGNGMIDLGKSPGLPREFRNGKKYLEVEIYCYELDEILMYEVTREPYLWSAPSRMKGKRCRVAWRWCIMTNGRLTTSPWSAHVDFYP